MTFAPNGEADAWDADRPSAVEPALKPLLDVIASELAHEYIRLMEAAATAPDHGDAEGFER
jgi:hypothetical protein